MTRTRVMPASELSRIAEIDRSEHITQQYSLRSGALHRVDVDIHAPRWGEPGEKTVEQYVDAWSPVLACGGTLLGSFEADRLAGFAIFDTTCADEPAILSALYVTRPCRRRGIARELTREVVRQARSSNAPRLYVSATPTCTTVDFYLAQGFELLSAPNARLLVLEPEDIHLALRLAL